MKSILKYIGVFIVTCIAFCCSHEDIMQYDKVRGAIEFEEMSGSFSFMTAKAPIDTIDIPFVIQGFAADHDRDAHFVIVTDSTTAKDDQFRILSAIVPAGQYNGVIKLELTNNLGSDFEDIRIYLQTSSNENFVPGVNTQQYYYLTVTNNKLIRPSGWDSWTEQFRLGNYSNAYYAFIISTTGETNFPIRQAIPGYNDGKQWSKAQTNAFLALLKDELKKRNEREGSPLLHDEGTAEGKEVKVGVFYQ